MKILKTDMYLLLIDEETKIGDNNYFINVIQKEVYRNNIENYNVNKDYLKLIIAYYPLNKEAKELDLPLLPNPFEVTKSIEHLAEEKADVECQIDSSLDYAGFYKGFIAGYKAAQSKQFSLEDMQKAFEAGEYKGHCEKGRNERSSYESRNYNTFKEFIQSLSTQQLPKEFIPTYIKERKPNTDINGNNAWIETLKTIKNSEGKEELVGKYQY